MSYSVNVYFNGQWIATLYDIPGEDQYVAQEYVEENYPLEFEVVEND
jgi:hypothetical protein